MTTHVLIVDSTTFKVHLEYMFAGTGAKDRDVDFNCNKTTKLHHSTENSLVAMMADGSRVRKGDCIVFYVQENNGQEGKFYGVFKAKDDGIFLEHFDVKNPNGHYLYSELNKNLTFRFEIEPEDVYPEGVTEWQALDVIRGLNSPNQMLWSLIYRKLRGNRGNTMITIYEADKLFQLIKQVNSFKPLKAVCFSFDGKLGKIVPGQKKQYSGGKDKVDLLPRMASKYQSKHAHEMHLQQYIMQHIGDGGSLDNCLGIKKDEIEWLGNEVSCGVGMQRIDIMISANKTEIERKLFPIELKAVEVKKDTVNQLDRYIDWIEQYYIGNRQSTIQPVLICKDNGKKQISNDVKNSFDNFNSRAVFNGGLLYLPLIYIQYKIIDDPYLQIVFNKINY